MNSPIQPIRPLGSPGRSEPARAAASGGVRGADFESHLRHAGGAAEALPQGPPPEVLEEIAAAARTNDLLRASGQNVSFIHDEYNGGLTIELRDSDGALLRTLSVTEALDLAAGRQ